MPFSEDRRNLLPHFGLASSFCGEGGLVRVCLLVNTAWGVMIDTAVMGESQILFLSVEGEAIVTSGRSLFTRTELGGFWRMIRLAVRMVSDEHCIGEDDARELVSITPRWRPRMDKIFSLLITLVYSFYSISGITFVFSMND